MAARSIVVVLSVSSATESPSSGMRKPNLLPARSRSSPLIFLKVSTSFFLSSEVKATLAAALSLACLLAKGGGRELGNKRRTGRRRRREGVRRTATHQTMQSARFGLGIPSKQHTPRPHPPWSASSSASVGKKRRKTRERRIIRQWNPIALSPTTSGRHRKQRRQLAPPSHVWLAEHLPPQCVALDAVRRNAASTAL